MIATVSFDRVDLFRLGRCRETGKRNYLEKFIDEHDFEKVQFCVRSVLGL